MKDLAHARGFGWLSFVLVAGYFLLGLWPFDFWPLNRVDWLPDRSGLQFAPYGLAYDPTSLSAPPEPGGNAQMTAVFTVELWLEPQPEPANNVFHILTIHNRQLPLDFTLGQWKRDFLLRGTTQPRQPAGKIPEAGLDNTLSAGKTRFFTV